MNKKHGAGDLTRRSVLLGTGVVATTAGCNLIGGSDPEPTSSGSGTGGSGVELTLALVPDPPGASEFYRAQMDLFEEANSGITVNVIENPADQQLNALELMFQQGEAPDVFRCQGTPALTRFAERGWTAPLDDLVTDEFTARFAEGSLAPASSGLHYDGHLMSVPLVWGDWGPTALWMYNADILAEYGFDAPPATWSEMEEMARAITEEGNGQVFGLHPDRLDLMMYGSAPYGTLPNLDLTTGSPHLADDTLVELVEMFRRLQSEGVIIPGWEVDGASPAFSDFAAGRFAMYPSATWHVAEARKLAPDMNLKLAPIPVPDSGRRAYSPRSAAFQPIWSMSSESAHPEESLLLMDFLASIDFYRAYYEEFGSFTASQIAWEDQARENPDQAGILDVSAETLRTVPNPQLLAEGAEDFWAAITGDPELRAIDVAKDAVINDVDFRPLAEGIDQRVEELLVDAEADVPNIRDLLTFEDYDPLADWTRSQ
ncbi:ABC transporter substrate-binding protein [Ruania rhizosphaerae]|uniref:ABC transporter substrate-binding protein n=1 Tax=Ruania rhizosphaerae TaxID=1840413 RepID=UPI00135AFECC|nr:extracellular solute-binding protein [Ruania rhizosphaerae]